MRNAVAKFGLISTLLLAGCATSSGDISSSSSENSIAEGDYVIKEATSIDFLCMVDGSYYSLLENMIKEFEKEEPYVEVNLTNPLGAGNYNTLEKTIVAGFFKEDYPDIVQCYPDNVVKYLDRGYVVDVSSYMKDKTYGVKGDDYINSFLEEGSSYSEEGTYSLPFCKSTELLYYNADVLLGLDLSSVDSSINEGNALDADYLNNLTWEELFGKLCPAIKTYNSSLSDEEKIYVDNENSGIFTYDSDENFFITLANQYGYGYTGFDEDGKGTIDYDNDGMKSLMKTLYEAKNNGYLQTRNTHNDYVSYLFQSREALFTVSSTAGLSYNFVSEYDQKTKGLSPFSIGVAKIPYAKEGVYSSINQGPSVCILDHQDENRSLASYLLWKYLTNESNATTWSLTTGYIGVRDSVYSSDEYKAAITVSEDSDIYTRGAADNLKKIAEVKDLTYNTAVFRGSSNARTNVGKLMKACLISEDLDSEIDILFAESVADTEGYLGN